MDGELYSGGYTTPNALNNNNEMVGQSSQGDSANFQLQAFYWNSNTGIVGLGFLPGYTNSAAQGINDASQVVGYCFTGGGQAGFVWNSGAGWLNSVPAI